MNISLRRRKPSDIPDLVRVLEQVYQSDRYPVEGIENAEAWLQPQDLLTAWVATESSKPIGNISIIVPSQNDAPMRSARALFDVDKNSVAIICRFFVAPNSRGLGIGSQLLSCGEEFIASQKLLPMLEVMQKDVQAIRLYRNRGWIKIAEAEYSFSNGTAMEEIYYLPTEEFCL